MKTHTTRLITIALALCSATSWSTAQKPVVPVRVADLNPNGGSDPDELTTSGAANSLVYFTARIPRTNDSPLRRIYTTDGTAAGTQVIEDHGYDQHILQGNSTAIAYTVPEYSRPENNDLVLRNHTTNSKVTFRASDYPNMITHGARFNGDKFYMGAYAKNNTEVGTEPYVFSSTSSTATLLKNITTSSGGGSYPYGFTSLGSKMVFNALTETYGSELWITDGTAAGTVIVKDLFTGATSSGPSDFTTIGSNTYFVAENAAGNKELWITNGTTAGTLKLKEINPSATVGGLPQSLTAHNKLLYFTADNGTNGRELWMSNGTAAGTTMVKDIHPTGSSNPSNLVVYNGLLWFFATDGTLRVSHLYSTDGTAAGTTKRITIASGNDGHQLTVCNGKLFYTTRTSTTSKLWRTDGTGAGTQQVIPALAGNVNPIPNRKMAVMNNWLYFNADFDASGAELWKVQ